MSASLDHRAGPSSSSQRAEKPVANSGSSEDSMASELGRLSEENAHYRRKISELMGKSTAQPSHSRSSSGPLGGSSVERVSSFQVNFKYDLDVQQHLLCTALLLVDIEAPQLVHFEKNPIKLHKY